MSKKLGFIVILLLISAFSVTVYKSGEGDMTQRFDAFQKKYSLFLTPQQKFEKALQVTNDLNTAHMDFDGSVITKLTNNKNGITQNTKSNIKGYISGSTDGDVSRMELRISGDTDNGLEMVLGVITVDEGNTLYVSGPATQGKWQQFSKEELDKLSEDSPTDASLYIFDIVGTLFSKSKALLASTNTNTVLYEQVSDTQDKYHVEISVPSYISNQDRDDDYSDKEIADAKIILKEALISGDFWVDNRTNYVSKMTIVSKNMQNIPTPETQKLGLSAKFDANINLELSRYTLPTNISAPDEDMIVVPGVNQVTTNPLSKLK